MCVESTIRIVKAKHLCPHLDVFYVHSSNIFIHTYEFENKIKQKHYQIVLVAYLNLKEMKQTFHLIAFIVS